MQLPNDFLIDIPRSFSHVNEYFATVFEKKKRRENLLESDSIETARGDIFKNDRFKRYRTNRFYVLFFLKKKDSRHIIIQYIIYLLDFNNARILEAFRIR